MPEKMQNAILLFWNAFKKISAYAPVRTRNNTIHMPQKWNLSSSVKCIFRKTRANRILVKHCNVFIMNFDAQCNQKL